MKESKLKKILKKRIKQMKRSKSMMSIVGMCDKVFYNDEIIKTRTGDLKLIKDQKWFGETLSKVYSRNDLDFVITKCHFNALQVVLFINTEHPMIGEKHEKTSNNTKG